MKIKGNLNMAYRTEPGAEEQLTIDPETNLPYEKGKEKMKLVSMEEANAYHLDKSIAKIYLECPFLGYVFSSLKRSPKWDIPTAGISPDNELFFNPRFMASLTLEQQKYVLFHECLHRLHNHFLRGDDIMQSRYGFTGKDLIAAGKKGFDNAEDAVDHLNNIQKANGLHTLMNIAEDIAINQYCDKKFGRLPIGVHLNEVNKDKNLKMEKEREWEYYLSELEKDMKENPQNYQQPQQGQGTCSTCDGTGQAPGQGEQGEGEGEGEGDCPDCNGTGQASGQGQPGQGNPSGMGGVLGHDIQNGEGKQGKGAGNKLEDKHRREQEAAANSVNDELFKNIVRKGKNKQREYEANKGIGHGTNNSLLDVIPDSEIKLKDKNLWKSVISKRFGTMRISSKEMTLKRPNRRNPASPFGKRRKKVSKHNVVIIDTSGSCLNDLPQFFGVVQRACKKYGTTVDLLFTTTDLYAIYKNQRTMAVENYDVRSGGTDLTVAQRYIMDNYPKETSVICITDGYTDWLGKKDGYGFKTSIIYTKDHVKLEGISEYAVLDED
jgi:predicted metal-dependent peptidase